MIELKETDLYQEIDLIVDGTKIGEAEVSMNDKMISRLKIYEPFQDKGYGQQIVNMLIDKYGCDCLWVYSDNSRAIHVYEKCGFKRVKETSFLMVR